MRVRPAWAQSMFAPKHLLAVAWFAQTSAHAGGRSEKEQIIFIHDSALDDILGEVLLMEAAQRGEIDLLASVVINADSVPPSSIELVYKMRCALGVDPLAVPVGFSRVRLFNSFPWEYRRDSFDMESLPEIQRINCDIPPVFMDGDVLLERALMAAANKSVTLVHVAALTNLAELFARKPYLSGKVKQMVWMAGALDVPGNLEERQFKGFPKCTPDMKWGCKVNESFSEWNVFGDPFAVDDVFRRNTFPIYMVPLDLADYVPVPGEFMQRLRAVNSSKCNRAVYEAMYQSYAVFAEPQPFYRLWDSTAVMFALFKAPFAKPETSQLAVGTSWDYAGLMVRKREVAQGKPPLSVLAQRGSQYDPPAFHEVSSLLALVKGGASQLFQYAAEGACAASSIA